MAHTSCVSEAERYQGHLYVHKDNKGEVKQQAWLENVQSKLDSAGGGGERLPRLNAVHYLQRVAGTPLDVCACVLLSFGKTEAVP